MTHQINDTNIKVNDAYEFESDTPRPVDAESVARGAFGHLEEGQGAVSASRRPVAGQQAANEKPEEMDRRTIALIVLGMAVALVLVLVFVVGAISAPAGGADQSQAIEQVAVAANKSVELRGRSYSLEEQDGTYRLMESSQSESSQPLSLGEIAGTPAGLVLYDGAIIVPQNLKGGTWDVMAYTIGSGWSQLMDKDGNATTGKGKITSVQLDGSTLVLSTDSKDVQIPLVW